ncbi:alpha/beta fold hydrolase [Mycobacterium sp. 3519A]|uniref:alpha/beta fold hydrolase n=1 Tax=Mycobacterium sp. 3519A TaxID=2057184 RepID=UPI000C7A52D2|nr:alpha/beta hydrolase [Mycobacterium sp. 3519A]
MTKWFNIPMELRYRTIDGLAIRVAETPPRGEQALLLSPWPESVLAFQPVWACLCEDVQLTAIDLPGFGRSERRPSLLSPAAMAEFIIRVIDMLGLDRPHAVGPGSGTAALLFAAARHPGRLRSLVISGASPRRPEPDELFAGSQPPDDGRIGDSRHLLDRMLSLIERYELPTEIRDDYRCSYEGVRFVESLKYMQSYPAELTVLRDLLADVSTPVRIIAARRDPFAPSEDAELLAASLPNGDLTFLDTGHFAWEDAADEYAELVNTFWRRLRHPISGGER